MENNAILEALIARYTEKVKDDRAMLEAHQHMGALSANIQKRLAEDEMILKALTAYTAEEE